MLEAVAIISSVISESRRVLSLATAVSILLMVSALSFESYECYIATAIKYITAEIKYIAAAISDIAARIVINFEFTQNIPGLDH